MLSICNQTINHEIIVVVVGELNRIRNDFLYERLIPLRHDRGLCFETLFLIDLSLVDACVLKVVKSDFCDICDVSIPINIFFKLN